MGIAKSWNELNALQICWSCCSSESWRYRRPLAVGWTARLCLWRAAREQRQRAVGYITERRRNRRTLFQHRLKPHETWVGADFMSVCVFLSLVLCEIKNTAPPLSHILFLLSAAASKAHWIQQFQHGPKCYNNIHFPNFFNYSGMNMKMTLSGKNRLIWYVTGRDLLSIQNYSPTFVNTRHKHTLHKNAGAVLSMSNNVCPAAEGHVSNKLYCMLEEVDTQYQVCLCVHCKGHICLNKQTSLVESLNTTFHDLSVIHN